MATQFPPNKLNNDEIDTYPWRVVVKFYDNVPPPLIDEQIVSFEEQFPDIRIDHLFTAERFETVLSLVDQARDLDPDYQPPAFVNYFIITVPLGQDPDEIVVIIREWSDLVEYVYVRPMPAPPSAVTPNDEINIGNQGYVEPHNPAHPTDPTYGVDARYAWENLGNDGGDGQGVKFIDLEQGWFLIHNDLPSGPTIPLIHGVDIEAIDDIPAITTSVKNTRRAHGTRTLGVVVAADNGSLVLGIAPNAEAAVVSTWLELPASPVPGASLFQDDIPNAILSAIENLNYGDVLLLEAQLNTSEPQKYDPIEIDPLNFNMIRLATALGIIVVEAAGNGNNEDVAGGSEGAYNLDIRPRLGTDPPLFVLDRSGPDFQDSLAVMVAASTSIAPHQRLVSGSPIECIFPPLPTNFGSRIDCYAWGQCVFTIGHESGAIDGVTSNYNGTSSASAIIAGVAILVQAIAENNPAIGRFSPGQLRDILSDELRGTTSPDSAVIGVMPDLGRIIPHYIDGEALSDVYIRDHVGDSGEPHTGSISASPDVIVRAESNPNPSAFSGTDTINSNTLGSTVTDGQDHFVYVRALNRGAAATGVMADVYYSPPITLQSPALWTYVGRTPSGTNVPADTTPLSITVLDPISWPSANLPPDDDGFTHYCFIATIWSDDDPNPMPEPVNLGDLVLQDIDDFRRLIRDNNNITWRNFNVVEMNMGAGLMGLMFMAAGWPNAELPMRFEVGARLPKGAQMWLEGPKLFMEKIIGNRQNFEKGNGLDRVRVPVNPHGVNQFLEVPFPSELRAKMQLLVDIPEEQRKGVFEIYARQLYQGEEVGRVTWLLAPPGF